MWRLLLAIIALLVCGAMTAAPKEYRLIADFRKAALVERSNGGRCLREENGLFPSGSVIWERLSRIKTGANRVVAFVAFEEGLSFTGEKRVFPYQLIVEIDPEGRIRGGFALMPFWSEPYDEALVGCVVPGGILKDGMSLGPDFIRRLSGGDKPSIDYTGILRF